MWKAYEQIINCQRIDCDTNCDGVCCAGIININENGICSDWQSQ